MRLPFKTIGAYSLPSLPLAMLLTPIIIYLPAFYAQHLGTSLSALGVLFFIGRLFDGITDPIIGRLSDRFSSRFGRRKPWLLIGTVPLMIATYLLCRPPEGSGFVYLLLALVLFYVAYTAVRIPYISWGAELSYNYAERNRISGFREMGSMIGILLSVAMPYFFLKGDNASLDNIMMVFTISVLILLPIAALIAARVPDSPRQIMARTYFMHDLRLIWKNRPFIRILTAQGVLFLGTYIYNACLVFLIESTMGLKGDFLSLILIEYVAMIAFVPAVIYLANRISKHRVMALGIMLQMIALTFMFFVTPGSYGQAAICFALVGISFAPWYILPTSLIADTVDYGRWQGGSDSSGFYMAIFNFVDKAALALAALIALPLLDLLGYIPDGDNTSGGLLAVKIVATLLPVVIILAAVLIYWHYPITKTKHSTIIKGIHRRDIRTDTSMQ